MTNHPDNSLNGDLLDIMQAIAANPLSPRSINAKIEHASHKANEPVPKQTTAMESAFADGFDATLSAEYEEYETIAAEHRWKYVYRYLEDRINEIYDSLTSPQTPRNRENERPCKKRHFPPHHQPPKPPETKSTEPTRDELLAKAILHIFPWLTKSDHTQPSSIVQHAHPTPKSAKSGMHLAEYLNTLALDDGRRFDIWIAESILPRTEVENLNYLAEVASVDILNLIKLTRSPDQRTRFEAWVALGKTFTFAKSDLTSDSAEVPITNQFYDQIAKNTLNKGALENFNYTLCLNPCDSIEYELFQSAQEFLDDKHVLAFNKSTEKQGANDSLRIYSAPFKMRRWRNPVENLNENDTPEAGRSKRRGRKDADSKPYPDKDGVVMIQSRVKGTFPRVLKESELRDARKDSMGISLTLGNLDLEPEFMEWLKSISPGWTFIRDQDPPNSNSALVNPIKYFAIDPQGHQIEIQIEGFSGSGKHTSYGAMNFAPITNHEYYATLKRLKYCKERFPYEIYDIDWDAREAEILQDANDRALKQIRKV